jgi:pimeloyl-ACP methyl ester carboxylesterase
MKILYLFFLLLLLIGCSAISPVTWDERIKKSAINPIKLAYEEKGSGHVILFLHGFAESRFTWRYLADGLAPEYRVISLDLKGFGESPKPKDGHYSIYDQAMAVQQFIEEHQLKNITLVGHSFGGGVALALTLMAKETPSWQIDRLILLGAAGYKQNLPSMLQDLNRPLIGRIGVYLMPAYYQAIKGYEFAFYDNKKIPAAGVVESAKNFSRKGSRYVFLHTARQLIPDDINEISQQYSTIKQPALLIWGDKDRIIPRRYGYRLHKDLPNSRLEILPNVGHMTQEEAPEKVLSLIKDFMQ